MRFWIRALAGEKFSDVFIVDCHAHLNFWKAAFPWKVELDGVMEIRERIGIDIACINEGNCPDIRLANDDVGKAIQKHPERLAGFVTTSPSLVGGNMAKILNIRKKR